MARAYNVIDADGHILEPLNLWTDYIEPKYRDQAPRLIRDADGKQRLQVGEQVLGSKKGLGALGGVGARDGTVVDDAMEYEQGRKGGFDPHARIPDMDLDGIDAAFLYPSIGLFAGAVQRSADRRGDVARLQPLARGLLQAVSGPAVRHRHDPDAVGRSGDRGDALRAREARLPRRLPAAQSVQQQDDPSSGLREVLDDGRGTRHLGRVPRGRQQRHDAGRHGPLRGARCAPHHHPHDGNDAGLHGGDLGRRMRASSEDPHRVPGVGRRLDRRLAGSHGPAFRRQGVQRFRPEDAARPNCSSATAGSRSSRSSTA